MNFHPVYRPDIDGLRAISIILVIIYHAYPNALPSGFIGVDIFFVISGYLISSIILKSFTLGNFNFLDFYEKRVIRIFPALFITLVITTLLGLFFFLPKEMNDLSRHLIAGASFLSNILLWHEADYFDVASEYKPLLHLWSLGVEEQFYILWPILIFFAVKYNKLFLIILLIFLMSFIFSIITINFYDSVSAFYLPHNRFWELLSGSCLAYLQIYKTNPNNRINKYEFLKTISYSNYFSNLKSILGFTFLFIAIIYIDKNKAFPGYWALLPVISAFLIISSGNNAWVNKKFLSNNILVLVGKISFPLYLIHWPLLSFLRISGLDKYEYAIPSVVVLTFVLSYLIYHYVETPIRKKNDFKLKFTLILVFLMVLILSVAIFIYRQDGLPNRFKQMKIFEETLPNTWRSTECFIDGIDNDIFSDTCIDKHDINRDLIVLWGDSLAAHLFPGFLQQQKIAKSINIAQFSTSSCPPVIGFESLQRPLCKKINSQVFQKIIKLKPKIVILSADWYNYPQDKIFLNKLQDTISFLKTQGGGMINIILIGTFPRWSDPLPRKLFNISKENYYDVPTRLEALNTIETDKLISKIAKENKINFIDPKKYLCNRDGCLTIVRNKKDNLDHIVSFDTVHLSDYGSEYLVEKIFLNEVLNE